MIVSTKFLKDYVDIDVDLKTLAEDMTKAGNEYDSATKLINATNLVIGEVLECKMHPDSDHLHVCQVNIGSKTTQIVCGAPNVRKGLKVIVALPGAELPEKSIKAGVIRGQESNGMLCALSEIGIDNKFLKVEDKDGIHELPQDAPVGGDPVKYMQLDDEVIDFDLTPDRGDLLSMLGMAYEIGAIYDKKVKDVDLTHGEKSKDIKDEFTIKVDTDNCSVLLVKKVENVQIKESPTFIKNRLIACGIRPINNVVDISNYVMLELGQPLHFYDADKLQNCLEVRMAKQDEKLTTLDGNERTLSTDDIVISNGKEAIGLAGVMGGLDTEITENTKNVIIESAIFNPARVRKTSQKILRSEASNRFEKGIDPNRTYMAIERACKLLEQYADATIESGMCKYDKTEKEEKVIDLKYKDVCDLLGTEISKEDIVDVFRKLDFKYIQNDESVTVTVPSRRLDISIKEDLIEEVSRIYGVDNIEGILPVVNMKSGTYDKTTRDIRAKMVSLGLNETLSYILIPQSEVHKYVADEFEELKLLDPLTPERDTLRYSVIPSMVRTYEYNKAHYNKDVSIFEIGKGFFKKGEQYGENQKLACLMTGEYYLGLGNKANVDFYIVKGIIEDLLDYLGYENRYSFILPKNIPAEFHPGQTAEISVNADTVGIIGKLHPSICKEAVYVFEINLDKLLSKRVGNLKYKEISKFPNIKKDVAFVMNKDVQSKQIETTIKKAGGNLLTNIEVFDIYTGENVGENEKSIAYALTFNDSKKTLTDEEVNSIFEKIITTVESKCGVKLRK